MIKNVLVIIFESLAVMCVSLFLMSSCQKLNIGQAKAAQLKKVSNDSESTFNKYCISCHGSSGTGNGIAAAALQQAPRNFTDAQWQSAVTDEKITEVIRDGGSKHGQSMFMPAWGGIISDESITGLIAKIRSFDQTAKKPDLNAPQNPMQIYTQYCYTCHGGSGLGDGPIAKDTSIVPTNFTDVQWQDRTSDEAIRRVIREGGSAVGKSSGMPGWGTIFDKQMGGLVKVIRSFAQKKSEN